MESQQVKAHIPCPHCGSKDNATEYTDHYYCFGCEKRWSKSEDNPSTGFQQYQERKLVTSRGCFRDLPDRYLTESTCKKFGVSSLKTSEGIVEHYYPYYNKEGKFTALKTRKTQTKEFSWEGDSRECMLFGQQLFPKGGRYVTICEGEIDCMSAYQIFGGTGAYVSVKNGAKDVRTIKENYEWLDSFENIILCLDGDTAGREAAIRMAEILPPKKTKIVKLSEECKDVNEFLKNRKGEEFRKLWWSAEEYRPEDIVNVTSLLDRVMDYRKTHQYMPTPWEGLNEMLQGTRAGQLAILTSGSGMGKSIFLRTWMLHLMQTYADLNVGGLFMEESVEETVVSLMSTVAGKNLKKPAVWEECSKEELTEYFYEASHNGRIELFEPKEQTTPSYIANKIRYLAMAKGCKVIFLDHLTFLVDTSDDIRKDLNRLSKDIKEMCVALDITVIAAIHLRKSQSGKDHESGAVVRLDDIKDSSSVKQLSDIVIALERDSQNEDRVKANTTTMRVLKNRDFGAKGVACGLLYDSETTRLQEIPADILLSDVDDF